MVFWEMKYNLFEIVVENDVLYNFISFFGFIE